MINKLINRINLVLVISFAILAKNGISQTPDDNYFHKSNTILPYASMIVALPTGSVLRIPFTPVIQNYSPTGSNNLTKSIDVRGRLVYVGNGIVAPEKSTNSYKNLNFQGRIVLITYNMPEDFQARYGNNSDLHIRVNEAYERGASAVVLFGVPGNKKWDYPFISLPDTNPKIKIPLFSISHKSAQSLFENLGYNFTKKNKLGIKSPDLKPIELPATMRITLMSGFQHLEQGFSSVKFLKGVVTVEDIKNYLLNKDLAVKFISSFFKSKENIFRMKEEIYFPDLNSFKFFTKIDNPDLERFGRKLKLFSTIPNPNMLDSNTKYYVFHESLHETLLDNNFSINGSISEGIVNTIVSNYTNSDNNELHNEIAELMKLKILTPVFEIITNKANNHFNISKNDNAYISSFINHLYNFYGEKRIKTLIEFDTNTTTPSQIILSFSNIFGKEFISLEREWVELLSFKYDISSNIIEEYMEKARILFNKFNK